MKSSGDPLRQRKLTQDEITLWREVAKRMHKRPEAQLPELPEMNTAAKSMQPQTKAPPRASASVATAPPYQAPAQKPVTNLLPLAEIEPRLVQRLRSGQLDIDAVLDLHGMTQHQAHSALISFLLDAQQRQSRLVLVITGKGRVEGFHAIGSSHGVLRQALPHWLRTAPLQSIVLGFDEAGPRHGGSGALNIRLRRKH